MICKSAAVSHVHRCVWCPLSLALPEASLPSPPNIWNSDIHLNQRPTALHDNLRTCTQQSWRTSTMPLKMSGLTVDVRCLPGCNLPKSLHAPALIWQLVWASAWSSTEASSWSANWEFWATRDNRVRRSTAESHSSTGCSVTESRELAVLVRGAWCSGMDIWLLAGGAKNPQAALLRRANARSGSHSSKRFSSETGSSRWTGEKIWIT